MDSRIAENTRQFLAAAQAITPQDTLISGYCSRVEQGELYNEKVDQLALQYGFVLRYPDGKSDITGVDFENWHYCYVGVENAQYMQKHNLVLEEYIALLKEAGK